MGWVGDLVPLAFIWKYPHTKLSKRYLKTLRSNRQTIRYFVNSLLLLPLMLFNFFSTDHAVSRKPERTVVFVHIPKAAGSSFTAFLQTHFPKNVSLVNTYWEILRKQPLVDLSQYRLITGHFGFNLTNALNAPFVITLLRDPVDRACSTYEYLRAYYQKHPAVTFGDPDIAEIARQWKVAVNQPFEHFFESELPVVRASVFDNPQARQLALDSPYELTDLSSSLLRQIALSRLPKIDVLGCQEDFDATITVTCQRLGWSLPRSLTCPRTNATPADALVVRRSLSSTLRRKIEHRAEIDMELHALARERLREDHRQT